jgi:hypothetical protein
MTLKLFAGLAIVASLSQGCATSHPKSTAILGTTTAPAGYYEQARQSAPAFEVREISTDTSYRFSAQNLIKVGGQLSEGARNELRYLNALRGPGGQIITYERRGSCCPFKPPTGLLNNTGMLDNYAVTWEGNAKPLTLYLNMCDGGDMKAPIGFTVA